MIGKLQTKADLHEAREHIKDHLLNLKSWDERGCSGIGRWTREYSEARLAYWTQLILEADIK